MFGAITGDVVGSKYEFHNIKSRNFPFLSSGCHLTDDSIMTIAIAKALHESKKNKYEDLEKQCIYWMCEIGQRYPRCGFGSHFRYWLLKDPNKEPYNSFGNGSAMRTSECGMISDSLEQTLDLAKRCASVTHNHPEGIKGAQATSACIYLARTGKSKDEIGKYINDNFYKLDFTIEQIQPTYTFDVTCQGSIPQAIECFLESESFKGAIRNCMYLGGDCDTTGAIAGAIAEAYYGIPEDTIHDINEYLDDYLKSIISSIQ